MHTRTNLTPGDDCENCWFTSRRVEFTLERSKPSWERVWKFWIQHANWFFHSYSTDQCPNCYAVESMVYHYLPTPTTSIETCAVKVHQVCSHSMYMYTMILRILSSDVTHSSQIRQMIGSVLPHTKKLFYFEEIRVTPLNSFAGHK